MSFPHSKVLFGMTALFACFVIFYHLLRQSVIRQKIAFLWYNSSLLSLDNQIGMSRWKIVAEKVPRDDPYSPILYVDKESRFLDPETRRFLTNSRFFAFPSKYKKVFVDTLVEFDRVWRQKLNRTYILYGGTLLGAYRHGQMIPWDDDLDVLVDLKYNKTLEQDLKGTKFNVSCVSPFRKLFFAHNGTTKTYHGRWPFIDLFFFTRRMNGNKIKTVGFDLLYPINHVFPAIMIPHESRMFLGPRCPEKVIQSKTTLMFSNKCCTNNYNHRLDKNKQIFCISCSKLHGLFRFITWRQLNATHSQQMISDPPEPNEMAAVYKSKEEMWKRGPVVFMPQC